MREVDGHNVSEITGTVGRLDTVSGPPHLLIANTVFGKGVSYMEGQIKWHYWPMSDEEYEKALEEIASAS